MDSLVFSFWQVNFIENALQVSLDVEDPAKAIIHDVQIKTVTRPDYS